MSQSERGIDKFSTTWVLVEKVASDIVAKATAGCISADVAERRADRLRGRIEAAKEILKLAAEN